MNIPQPILNILDMVEDWDKFVLVKNLVRNPEKATENYPNGCCPMQDIFGFHSYLSEAMLSQKDIADYNTMYLYTDLIMDAADNRRHREPKYDLLIEAIRTEMLKRMFAKETRCS
jgi:hypothetical protein